MIYDWLLDVFRGIGERHKGLVGVGVPFGSTVDQQTFQDESVTVRSRDSMDQVRIKVSELDSYLVKTTAYP